MSQLITGGSVTYERRVKTGDFEHKVLAVTLTFSTDEPNSAIDEVARSRAVLLVEQGLKEPARVTLAEKIEQAKPHDGNPVDVVRGPGPTAPPKKTRKVAEPKTDAASVEAGMKEASAHALKEDWPEGQVNGGKDRTVAEALKAAEPPARIIDTGEKVEPSKMIFPGDSRAASNADLITGAVPSSGIDRSEQSAEPNWDAVAEPPTYEHVLKHVTAAVGRGVKQPVIRELFAPLLPQGSEVKLSLIPAAARQSFLDELAKL